MQGPKDKSSGQWGLGPLWHRCLLNSIWGLAMCLSGYHVTNWVTSPACKIAPQTHNVVVGGGLELVFYKHLSWL